MDFAKIQHRRERDRQLRQLVQVMTVVLGIGMVLTLLPKVHEQQKKREISASADAFLKMVQANDLAGAYEGGLTRSLKSQHPRSAFESTFRHLIEKKGGPEEWQLTTYASHPGGKPYELLSYHVSFAAGIGSIDFAMEVEQGRWKVRAYRIHATGI